MMNRVPTDGEIFLFIIIISIIASVSTFVAVQIMQ